MDERMKIIIERTYDAPRERVFKAWLEPKDLMRWFYASEGWTTPFAEIDARQGGAFRIAFRSPDGKNDFVFDGVYDEVVEPGRIVFIIGDGRKVWVVFDEVEGKTKITLTLTLETVNSEELQRQGWTAMLDHLAEIVETA